MRIVGKFVNVYQALGKFITFSVEFLIQYTGKNWKFTCLRSLCEKYKRTF